jgi:hypothetical protein
MDSSGKATRMTGFPLVRGFAWAGGRVHTPSRVPQQWGATSCLEAAPLTYTRRVVGGGEALHLRAQRRRGARGGGSRAVGRVPGAA